MNNICKKSFNGKHEWIKYEYDKNLIPGDLGYGNSCDALQNGNRVECAYCEMVKDIDNKEEMMLQAGKNAQKRQNKLIKKANKINETV